MNQQSPNEKGQKSPLFNVGILAMLGFEMGVAVAIGYFLGNFLDKKFHSSPWLTIVFFILGAIAAFRLLVQRTRMVR